MVHGKSEFQIDRHRSLIHTFRKTSQFEKIKANHKTEKQREREKEREGERGRENVECQDLCLGFDVNLTLLIVYHW